MKIRLKRTNAGSPGDFKHEQEYPVIFFNKPVGLMELLSEAGLTFPSYCAGEGICGKCAVRVISGNVTISRPDKESELRDKGMLGEDEHLACQIIINDDCEIITGSEPDNNIYIPELTEAEGSFSIPKSNDVPAEEVSDLSYSILIDLGTTTIVFALVDHKTMSIIDTFACINRQRVYGSDVMSRIKAAVNGKLSDMRRLVMEDIKAGIDTLVYRNCIYGSKTQYTIGHNSGSDRILIAGNTVMLHILRGMDLAGLASYPFIPESLEEEDLTISELFDESIEFSEGERLKCMYSHVKVTVLPGLSAFVGADITAGLLSILHDDNSLSGDQSKLFVDLGTNAEMALFHDGRIYASSAAAGPAFEGGHISCGMGSIPGAVRKAWLQYGLWRYETIGRKKPTGICGSGLISAVAAALENGFISRDGNIRSAFHGRLDIVPGSVYISQDDIRAFQEAKSAICSGIEILIEKAGACADDIKTVYVSGGFGSGSDPDCIKKCGLIPKELKAEIITAGNTVIKGLFEYLRGKAAIEAVKWFKEIAVTYDLSMEKEFNDLYIRNMIFF